MKARAGRRSLVATVAVCVLAAGGVPATWVAVTVRQPAPQPALSVARSLGPSSLRVTPPPPTSLHPGQAVVVGPVLPSSAPVVIDVPAIGVHSTLLSVGLTAQQTLEVPAPGPDYDQAAWYQHSPTPGSLGPAVILGHVDSATEGPSVFFSLGDLQQGATILVTRADGVTAVFEVDEVRRYAKEEFPTTLVYGDTDHAALRLITCGGSFDRATGQYRDNVVVFASLVGSQ